MPSDDLSLQTDFGLPQGAWLASERASRPGENGTASDRMPRTETVDWYSEGQSRTIIIGDQEVHVRFVGRKGRRGRIVISAPAGARFREE